MTKPYDTKLVMMVAQASFVTQYDRFCTLIPVVYVDGERALADEFPNSGEIWWKLTQQTMELAQPGRLVVGLVEDALKWVSDDAGAARYQVKPYSVQQVDVEEGMQVLDLPGAAISEPRDLVAEGFYLEQDTPSTPVVLVRWRGSVYGPFNLSDAPTPSGRSRHRYSLTPLDTDGMTVYASEQSEFEVPAAEHSIVESVEVSLNSYRRAESFALMPVRVEFLLNSGFERWLASRPRKLTMEPLNRQLQRYAKRCLIRSKRQQLVGLLAELELNSGPLADSQTILDAVTRVRASTGDLDNALDSVAEALLKSGYLGEDRVARAEEAATKKYVEGRRAELNATVDVSIAERQATLQDLETRARNLRGELDKRRAEGKAALEQEIAGLKDRALLEIAQQRAELDGKRAALIEQERVLGDNLVKVTADLRSAGDDVINRYLTIRPLLDLQPAGGTQQRSDSPGNTEGPLALDAPFEIPAFARAGRPPAETSDLSEQEFLERFKMVVAGSGFTYRPIDLLRFHLSVKCGDITVLGGPSGTGKSSLPALYAQALLGDESDRPGCLMVNVSPSWMDPRDLLGHLNTLEGRFYPAESGLFQHLAFAMEELAAYGDLTGLYMACLDEMNLSQVEHYFSEFMAALPRFGSARSIQCFTKEAARVGSAFLPWARLTLSPAVRFVGTVNFDETTRLLSDRLLDRINLINLPSPSLPSAPSHAGQMATATGRMITLADFERWQAPPALPPEFGALLDQMRPLLERLDCAMSPRVYRAVQRSVSSAAAVMLTKQAFDFQIAQRILPRVRSLVTQAQIDAADGLLTLMEQSSLCSFDESLPLLRRARNTEGQRGWGLEDSP